jgi:isoquinoline 1-oxidoreductase beta subunit
VTVSRRDFLITSSGVAAGLAIAAHVPDLAASAPGVFDPNVYIQITADDRVTLWVTEMEMGQGVRTLLPMMLAEELEADWTRLHLEQAMPGGRFQRMQLHTSGSGSSSDSYLALRRAGAAAREMLVTAAAADWGVPVDSCRAARGVVIHSPTGRTRTFGQLAEAASRLPVPSAPALKDPSQFHLLGTPVKRVDGPAIVTGQAKYGLDVRVPGMLIATIERAPAFGATPARIDDAGALKVPGVRRVLAVTKGLHAGVAVVADDTWSALQGREALHVDWTPGRAGGDFDSERFLASLPAALDRATYRVRHEGDADAALGRAARRLDATYVFPFQAHAPLETMNCTAHVRTDDVEIWVPTQTAVRTRQQAAKVSGLPEERIQVHCLLAGGGFGRRLFADFVAEAVELSQALRVPVQVFWTRADDMRHGYFQPATAERFTAGVDVGGALVALVHQTSSSDLTIYDHHAGADLWSGTPKARKAPDAYERDQSPWGAYDNPYEIAHLKVDCADVTTPVPVGPWRAVEYPSTVFGRESFLDELAHLTGQDPIAFRLALLQRDVKQVGPYSIDRGRLARVLETARIRSTWMTPLAHDDRWLRGRGVAASVYHADSYLAMIAEVSVARDRSAFRVDRMLTVVDCGLALNPLGVEGQTESGVTWGLSATLLGKMDFVRGAAVQGTFGEFDVLRLDQMPAIETIILDSRAEPGGYGEHPVPLVAPAVANAVFAASGARVRRLPLTTDALRAATS